MPEVENSLHYFFFYLLLILYTYENQAGELHSFLFLR